MNRLSLHQETGKKPARKKDHLSIVDSQPNRNLGHRRLNIRQRALRTGLILGLAGGAAAGGAVVHAIDSERANAAQPGCGVPVHAGDTLGGIQASLKNAGDDVSSETKLVFNSNGKKVDPKSIDAIAWGPQGPSRGVFEGGKVEIEHVDPNACIAVGGTVVSSQIKK